MNLKKRKIGLVTEDICSLPEKLINNLQIQIVKTKLYFPQWEKFPEKNLYQLMLETRTFPKTSAPPPGEYLKAFKKTLANYQKVLVITVSSKLSGCYSSALQAREIFGQATRIFLFDSLQAVSGQGLLVLEALRLIKEGKEIAEIIEFLDRLKKKIKFFGFLKTTFWVEKTGRVDPKLASAFKILKSLGAYPYFGIKNGKVSFSGFNFWTRDEFGALFNQLKHQAKKGKIKVGINYTDNLEFALKLRERIENDLEGEVAFLSLVPPIIGANSGPGTLIAACYHPNIKKRKIWEK